MPTPRKGETIEECRARENVRKKKYRTIRKTLDKHGTVVSTVKARDDRPAPQVIPTAVIKRTSTYTGADGRQGQWVIEEPEKVAQQQAMQAVADALMAKLEPLPPMPPVVSSDENLTVYPIGDLHKGLLVWKHESTGSWDIDLSNRAFEAVTKELLASTPSGPALITALGDFFHYDSIFPVTPKNRNQLDADSRYPKMIGAGIECLHRFVINAAAKHSQVSLIVEFGNHDPLTANFLAQSLALVYRDNPQISVNISPKYFHFYHFGKVLLMTHHGDKVKAADLPLLMAVDQPEAWGASSYRYIYTGHVHSRNVTEVKGVEVESFNILAPGDAWSQQGGYRAKRNMKAIVHSPELGEVKRYTVDPRMFGV